MAKRPAPEPPELPLLRLLLSSRWNADSLPAAERRIAEEGCDWDALLSLVRREGLAPLLWSVVRGRGLAPAHVEAALHDAYRENAIRNTVLWAELERVLEALQAAGIPVILLKGAALAEPVYGDIALRVMSDLDLLVRPEQARAAVEVLEGMGYAPLAPEPRPGFTFAYLKEIHLCRPASVSFSIDLHWDLVTPVYYRRQIAMDWFWQTAEAASFGRIQVRRLGAEAQLLHLILHLQVGHRGQGVRAWLDLVETVLAGGAELAWDVLDKQARGQGLAVLVEQALGVLVVEWHTPAPATVTARLMARAAVREARFYRSWRSPDTGHAGRFLAMTTGMSFGRALDFMLTFLFPSPAYIRERYARSEMPLWQLYPYHWLQYMRPHSSVRRGR